MPRVKRPTLYELEMLQSALMQGDWKIECPLAEDASPRKLDILSFEIEEKVLTLKLQYEGGGPIEKIKKKVRRVFLQGQLGTTDEPRKFSVSFREIGRAHV